MGFLKGLGTGLLSFLLFLSLVVFGIAFLFNSTVINPDFVVNQVDKLDISTLARDIVDEQLSEDLPDEAEFLKDAAYAVIADQEPWLKEQVNNALYTGYDYLLGKSDRLKIVIPLESLKTDFKESLWETLKVFLKQNASEIPEDLLVPYIIDYYEDLVSHIPEQLLPPEMIGLSGNALNTYLHEHYDQVTDILQTAILIPGVSDWILDQIRPYFDEYYDDFIEDIPSEQVYDEEEIPEDVMEQLQLARKYIGYFKTGYYALIAFIIVLIAGIALILRNVKEITRSLGISFTVYGILEFVGVLIVRSLDTVGWIPELPASMESWLSGLIKDFLAPLQWFSLSILIIGVVLLVVSFVYKPQESVD
jgi:hypothetical protein